MTSAAVRSALLLCAVLLSAACAQSRIRSVTDADAPRSLPAQGPVDVLWEDPAQFTEIRRSPSTLESRRGNWVEELALYLRTRSQPRLPPGERLEVVITNIDRAGEFEPWLGVQFHDTRIIRDLYPPRMELRFRRLGADGTVLAQGERSLTDGGFLQRASPNDSDPLGYEKSLIDDWLRRELPPR